MASRKLPPVHPGEILQEEFLLPLCVTGAELARTIRVPPNRVTRIIAGETRVSADTALRLSRALATTPQFWLNLQDAYDLALASDADGDISTITALRA
jgi:addiction module HigA family antidote